MDIRKRDKMNGAGRNKGEKLRKEHSKDEYTRLLKSYIVKRMRTMMLSKCRTI